MYVLQKPLAQRQKIKRTGTPRTLLIRMYTPHMPLQMLKAHETLSATLNDAHKFARLHPLSVYGHTPPATRLDEIRHGYR
jgi:hypothetical protein